MNTEDKIFAGLGLLLLFAAADMIYVVSFTGQDFTFDSAFGIFVWGMIVVWGMIGWLMLKVSVQNGSKRGVMVLHIQKKENT